YPANPTLPPPDRSLRLPHHGKIKRKGKSKSKGNSNGGWLAASALRAKRPAFALVCDFPW
ncbi:hypothetical protein JY411_15500, partial [Stenotrophomonas maltophilia]|nr:hypothetical protein [Stenotrophomonas maltophilia]